MKPAEDLRLRTILVSYRSARAKLPSGSDGESALVALRERASNLLLRLRSEAVRDGERELAERVDEALGNLE